jgi:hypothetical protein
MMYGDRTSSGYIAITIGVVAGAALLRTIWNSPGVQARRAGAKLPPGPKRDLIIGNLRNFPKEKWYETFTGWRQEFGEHLLLPSEELLRS